MGTDSETVIRFSCPTCKAHLSIGAAQGGQKVHCPKCTQKLLVPVPPLPMPTNKTVLGQLDDAPPAPPPAPAPAPAPTQPAAPVDVVMVEEVQNGRRRESSQHHAAFLCPHCGSREKPDRRQEIAPAGWILFAVLVMFFFPLCWLGLFMRETWEVCRSCGRRARKVEEMTLRF